MNNSRAAWQDVPEVGEPKAGMVRLASESADRGTLSGAHLVTDYFAVENRTKEPIRWAIPRKSNRLETLRRELRNSQLRFGLVVQDTATNRPQPVMGPLPLPEYRQPSCPVRQYHCPILTVVPFTVPTDQLYIPGLTWSFRTMFYRRSMDLNPLFTCSGLDTPGKEA